MLARNFLSVIVQFQFLRCDGSGYKNEDMYAITKSQSDFDELE